MTDAYFWVNGATEDEPVRCRAGSRRLGALRVGRRYRIGQAYRKR